MALVIWLVASEPSSHGTGPDVVLCVGDSFTYGLGAGSAEHAYPARVAVELDRLGRRARVVNGGWPGSTSRDVLRRLPGQLATHRPRLVYVLVGYNDFWSQPDALVTATETDGGDGFRLELRTLRLFRLLLAGLDRAAPPFVGWWHSGDLSLNFAPDGTIETVPPTIGLTWRLRGDQLVVHTIDQLDGAVVDWRIVDGRLCMQGGFLSSPQVLAPGRRPNDVIDDARQALERGDPGRAEELLRAALADSRLADGARRELVHVLATHDRRADAVVEVDRLAAEFADAPDAKTGADLVDLRVQLGQPDAAVDLLCELLDRGLTDARVATLVLMHGGRASDPLRLRQAVGHALARGGLPTAARLQLLAARSILGPDDDLAAMRYLVELELTRPENRLLPRSVRHDPTRFTIDLLDRCLAEMRLPPRDEASIRASFDLAIAAEDSTAQVLDRHLDGIVRTCRAAGAEAILLDYPQGHDTVRQAVRRTTSRTGAAALDVERLFQRLLRSGSRADWFILDGHCNDNGYRELGRLVAEDAARRL